MLRRPVLYALLALFAGALVLLLMLDDPSAISSTDTSASALFPQLSRAEHIDRIEVRNVTEGTGVLLVRSDEGLWYAPQMPQSTDGLPVESIDQAAVDGLALSITQLAAERQFEATPENLLQFGIRPTPEYTLQFAGHDLTGRPFESVVFEIGDLNPDEVGRYVWPRDGGQVFLVAIDFLLGSMPVAEQPALTHADEPLTATPAASVP